MPSHFSFWVKFFLLTSRGICVRFWFYFWWPWAKSFRWKFWWMLASFSSFQAHGSATEQNNLTPVSQLCTAVSRDNLHNRHDYFIMVHVPNCRHNRINTEPYAPWSSVLWDVQVQDYVINTGHSFASLAHLVLWCRPVFAVRIVRHKLPGRGKKLYYY